MSDPRDKSGNPGPPGPPPIFPPSINEAVFAPKRQMQVVKDAARKRLKKYHRKFEKLIRKYFKKLGQKERYIQFYDLGYRYEAVFYEITMDGVSFLGDPVVPSDGEPLVELLKKKLNLPTGDLAIELALEKDQDALTTIQLICLSESQEIKRLSELVERAPRHNNPGL